MKHKITKKNNDVNSETIKTDESVIVGAPVEEKVVNNTKNNSSETKNTIITLLLVIIVVLILVCGYFIINNKNNANNKEENTNNEIITGKDNNEENQDSQDEEDKENEETKDEEKITDVFKGHELVSLKKAQKVKYSMVSYENKINFFDENSTQTQKTPISIYECENDSCEVIPFSRDYNSVQTNLGYPTTSKYVLIGKCTSTDECKSLDNHFDQFTFYSTEDYDYNSRVSGTVELYNIQTGKVEKTYKQIKESYLASDAEGTLNIVLVEKSGNQIYVSYDGTVNKKLDNKITFFCYEGCTVYTPFAYEKNIIVTTKNGKQGIERLTDGTVIIEHKFDKIESVGLFDYNDPNYFIGKIGDKRSLYNIHTGEKITNKEYNGMTAIEENTLLVYKDQKMSIIDFKENVIATSDVTIKKIINIAEENVSVTRIDKKIGSDEYEIYISESYEKGFRFVYNATKKTLTYVK